MTIAFPSREFDDAVAAVCHGSAADDHVQALNELLRSNAAARDEYILRVELHSRLASEPDLFASSAPPAETAPRAGHWQSWPLALAACLAFVAAAFWVLQKGPPKEEPAPISKAVAMLYRTADAVWNKSAEAPRLNAPLEPGVLRLESGLAQIAFYSGARIVVEGPAELRLISRNEAFCEKGRFLLEVPAQARGFQIKTPHRAVTDSGALLAVDVTAGETALRAFTGTAKTQPDAGAFASLFDFQAKSLAAEARRLDQWRSACKRLEADPTLLLHFDFENASASDWQIRNLGNPRSNVSDAAIVGCQWTEGRWPEKHALEFQSVSDRVRVNLPGEYDSLTLAAWVSVKGLDRKINSLFMSDGFDPRTIHWLIRRDGALGLTVIGAEPRQHQIVLSPPVITLEKFGLWLHMAVVIDSSAQRVLHCLNGVPVSETPLKIAPPFRVGAAELGNWNAKGFPENDPFMIRNFSGAMDELLMFNRALDPAELRALYTQGKPQGEAAQLFFENPNMP